jgi:glycosyltransferase involved in cell wall biosynthesis
VCTSYVSDLLAGRGVDPKKMTVVMNCPDDAIFGRVAQGPTCDWSAGSQNAFRVVYHGGMLKRYGPDLLVKAAAQLAPRIPTLRVGIYGAGDFLPEVQASASEVNCRLGRPFVEVYGFVPTEAIPDVLAKADLGVVPMRADIFTDGLLPTKLMELATAGVPAVVARTFTTASYFSDNMVEYFKPGDVDDLAAKIYYLYSCPGYAQELAQNARAFAERHNWAGEKANYLALVDHLIGVKV